MPNISYQGESHSLLEGESVLDGLLRLGVPVSYSCRSGICQSCVMRAVEGELPSAAQQGLSDDQKARGLMLACSCIPKGDLKLASAEDDINRFETLVLSRDQLCPDIMRLRLRIPENYTYHAGQFLTLYDDQGEGRSYSLASVPGIDDFLELHIRHIEKGQVSTWVHQQLKTGDQLQIGEAKGECYYKPGDQQQSLLLIATGSGLAPLYGVIRDALLQGHKGSIHLYHGTRTLDQLYYQGKLEALDAENPQFHYHPCCSGETPPYQKISHGRSNDLALSDHSDLKNWRTFVCGHPDMVSSVKKKAFLAGASLSEIYADPFILKRKN